MSEIALDGSSHEVRDERCACGCAYHVAVDDPLLIWEPGGKREAKCTDRLCRCHWEPLRGEALSGTWPLV